MNTLQDIIQRFSKKEIHLEVRRKLPSGKEADLYLVSENENLFALKVYREMNSRSFQKNHEYLSGKHMRRTSEKRAVEKRNKFGKKLMHKLWVKREFFLLSKLYDAGADVPKPIEMIDNAILMEFIGYNSESAPLLKDVEFTPKEAKKVYDRIIFNIELFYKNGIVHSDLSEYNILYFNRKIFILDFPQSVDVRNNLYAEKLLERDKKNIEKWYKNSFKNN